MVVGRAQRREEEEEKEEEEEEEEVGGGGRREEEEEEEEEKEEGGGERREEEEGGGRSERALAHLNRGRKEGKKEGILSLSLSLHRCSARQRTDYARERERNRCLNCMVTW